MNIVNLLMESRKRRAGKSHYEEELIEKTSKDTSKSSKERGEKAYAPKMGTVINSPAESVLDDSVYIWTLYDRRWLTIL